MYILSLTWKASRRLMRKMAPTIPRTQPKSWLYCCVQVCISWLEIRWTAARSCSFRLSIRSTKKTESLANGGVAKKYWGYMKSLWLKAKSSPVKFEESKQCKCWSNHQHRTRLMCGLDKAMTSPLWIALEENGILIQNWKGWLSKVSGSWGWNCGQICWMRWEEVK